MSEIKRDANDRDVKPLELPSVDDLTRAEETLRHPTAHMRSRIEHKRRELPNLSNEEIEQATWVEQRCLEAQLPNIRVANFLRSLHELGGVPRPAIGKRELLRARLLYALHGLSTCSPITLSEFAQRLDADYREHGETDRGDAAGYLSLIARELAELVATGEAADAIGPLPAPFQPPTKPERKR